MPSYYFLDMITILRKTEEVILYANIFDSTEDEKNEVRSFLQQEFIRELNALPTIQKASFNPDAALWAAQVIYITAQLILYRKNKPEELQQLIPKDHFEVTLDNALSVDLCLRFLPELMQKLKKIDLQDELILLLEPLLNKWHYSNLKDCEHVPNKNVELWLNTLGFKQLYTDRIIHYKNNKIATNPLVNKAIKDTLTVYENIFWPNFSSIEIHD